MARASQESARRGTRTKNILRCHGRKKKKPTHRKKHQQQHPSKNWNTAREFFKGHIPMLKKKKNLGKSKYRTEAPQEQEQEQDILGGRKKRFLQKGGERKKSNLEAGWNGKDKEGEHHMRKSKKRERAKTKDIWYRGTGLHNKGIEHSLTHKRSRSQIPP